MTTKGGRVESGDSRTGTATSTGWQPRPLNDDLQDVADLGFDITDPDAILPDDAVTGADDVALADDEAAYAEFAAAFGWLDPDEELAREIEAEAAAKEAEVLRRIEVNEGAEAARQAIPVVRSWFRRESPTRSVRLLCLGLGCRMPVRRPEVRVRRSRRVGSARRARSPARRSSDDPSPPRDLARRAA